jgi:hypothetical protein
MPTMEELVQAYLRLYKEGKTDKAKQVADIIKRMQAQEDQIAPDEIPTPMEEPLAPSAVRERPEMGLDDRVVGALETIAALGTGASVGMFGQLGGTLQGLAQSILSGQFGTQEGARLVEQYAQRGAEAGTYSPRTAAGQEMVQAVAEPLSQLPPVMAGPAAVMRGAGVQARAVAPRFVDEMARAAQAADEAATRGFGAVRRGVEEILPTVSGRPEDIAAARQAGVRVMTTDVVSPESFATKWLQSVGEKIPIAGTGGPRAAQQRERVSAVEDLMREYEAPDAVPIINRVAEDLIQTRSDKLMRFKNEKTQAINNVDSAGVVPVAKTLAAIDDEIRALERLRTESVQPVIARLMDWRNALQGQSLANIETLRKQIGEAFKAPELASVRGTGEAALSRIYGPLREDMTDFIRQNGRPEDLTRWQVANKQLANLANELKVSSLRTALRKADQTPEAVGALLFSNKPSDVRALFRNLSPEGQRAARIAIMNRAAQKAGGIDNISPDRFANEVKRLGEQIGIAFPQDELARINGLVRALDLTRRAGQAGVTPPTGVQAVPLLFVDVLSSTFGGPMAATAGAATIGGLARLYESKAVRGLLTALGKAKRNSEAEGRIMGQLENAVAKELAKMTPATVPETARVQLQELEESEQ